MRSFKISLLVFIPILLLPILAISQPLDGCHIRLNRINNYAPGYIPNWLEAGVPITFTLQMRSDNTPILTADQVFKIESPDGAVWDPILAEWTSDYSWDTYFDSHKWWFYYSATGEGSDTVYFSGWTSNTTYPPTGVFLNAWKIYTQIESSEVGKTICLDSAWRTPINGETRWFWTLLDASGGGPDWSGPHCFTIVADCCQGQSGDINGDGNDANTLDINWLVNYIFRNGPPPPCPNEADLNGDSNNANVLDLNWLINYIFRFGNPPASCQ